MLATVHYSCAECRKPFIGPASAMNTIIPPGWQWRGSKVVCDDCCSGSTLQMRSSPLPRGATSPTTIMLRSGSYLDLADLDFSVIRPEDIAAGLRQLRFSGQTRQPYTIAQHSCLVLTLVMPIAREIGGEKGRQLRRCALMHDAAEALLHDISAPLKSLLPDYRAVEALFDKGLQDHFGYQMTKARKEIIKRADLQALAIEQNNLLGNEHPWPCLDGVDREALRGIHIPAAWDLYSAEQSFLFQFEQLFPSFQRSAA